MSPHLPNETTRRLGRCELDVCLTNCLPLAGGLKFQQPIHRAKSNPDVVLQIVNFLAVLLFLELKSRQVDLSEVDYNTSDLVNACQRHVVRTNHSAPEKENVPFIFFRSGASISSQA